MSLRLAAGLACVLALACAEEPDTLNARNPGDRAGQLLAPAVGGAAHFAGDVGPFTALAAEVGQLALFF